MRRKVPTENTSGMGRTSSRSVLGMFGGCPARKLRWREHMASGEILRIS